MNVLTIMASPHESGNTATVLGWVEEELESNGHNLERIELRKFNVNDCIGCLACQGSEDFKCAQTSDDANELFSRLAAADALVFASPLYCWSFPAAMHALLNRGLSQVKGYGMENHISTLDGKPTALLVTCMGPIEGNADLVGQVFDRVCDFAQMRKTGELVVPFCTIPDEISKNARKQALILARALVD